MLVEGLRRNPTEALVHMERWVNDGSPSGFSHQYSTSPETSPFGTAKSFCLAAFVGDDSSIRSLGAIPDWPVADYLDHPNWILIHPDMASHPELAQADGAIVWLRNTLVAPTSSGRTVQFLNGPQAAYVKLHYDGILGRVNRRLGWKAAISGVEVSGAILEALEAGAIDPRITVLRETGARAFISGELGHRVEWGMTWRDGTPWGPRAAQIKYVVPCFSLFSMDHLQYRDPMILKQLVEESSLDPMEYCLDLLILPIVDCYFSLIAGCGLQPEWNAQNLLIGLDEDLRPVGLVLRDLESVDKDLTIRETLGLGTHFASHPHKCIYSSQYNYRIKHSFMFDFKLGQYILDPLLQISALITGRDIEPLRALVQAHVDRWASKLPADFFPEDHRWYAFSPVLVDQSGSVRPYVSYPNPPFRS